MKKESVKLYTGTVYIVKNTINEKVYIGETLDTIEHRLHQHLIGAFYKNHHCYDCHFYRAIRKYGKNVFYIECLETITGLIRKEVKKKIQNLEKEYVTKFNSFKNGYNSDGGGLGGRIISEISKRKMSEKKKNNPNTLIHLASVRPDNSIPVDIYDYYSGEFICTEPSAAEIGRKYNVDSSQVIKCCIHPDKTTYITINNRRCAVRKKGVLYKIKYKYAVTDDVNSFIDYCVDLKQASEKYGCRRECIERCCKRKILSSGKKDGHKLIWSYYEERNH